VTKKSGIWAYNPDQRQNPPRMASGNIVRSAARRQEIVEIAGGEGLQQQGAFRAIRGEGAPYLPIDRGGFVGQWFSDAGSGCGFCPRCHPSLETGVPCLLQRGWVNGREEGKRRMRHGVQSVRRSGGGR